MKELLAVWLIVTGITIGCASFYGLIVDMENKFRVGLTLELVLTLIVIGGYLLI